MTEQDILACLAELPRVGTLFQHRQGGLVQVTGRGWDAGRDVAQVQYRHVRPEKIDFHGCLLWPFDCCLMGPTWHHDYTAEGWLRVKPDGVWRFEEVKS